MPLPVELCAVALLAVVDVPAAPLPLFVAPLTVPPAPLVGLNVLVVSSPAQPHANTNAIDA
jgi:hypothetical protein